MTTRVTRGAGLGLLCLLSAAGAALGASLAAPQNFVQEVAHRFTRADGLTTENIQLIDIHSAGTIRAFGDGEWFEKRGSRWEPLWTCPNPERFLFAGADGGPVTVALRWADVLQIVRREDQIWLATVADAFRYTDGQLHSLGWPSRYRIRQLAVTSGGNVWVASDRGLLRRGETGWVPQGISDSLGRGWGVENVLGVGFDGADELWCAIRAGVVHRASDTWRFYEGKDGLPWNEFTGVAVGSGEVWFGTRLGAIRFDAQGWHYRQGPGWLPHDEVRQVTLDGSGQAWFATPSGVGWIERRSMTLAEKAAIYEEEIRKYIQRTSFGYVAEAPLQSPGDRGTAQPQDSDNDGLWTAMYGAGQCFAYASTGDPAARARARRAFEALRFLQKVTQEGEPRPPKGYVARTIRPVEWPDPNEGRLARDREEQRQDRLWKVYEPRWPRTADGKWYWKSDTSSDELDGHFFFYPLYYEFCAEEAAEKERVREVVRDLADHLVEHGFALIDHDGKATRWAVFGPAALNRDPNWWPERGLNSLSILSYLAVAAYITGDSKYVSASRELIDHHGYAQNAMYPKLQNGPGSGNQSDDEMAFMCFYSLLRYSKDAALKAQIRWSFFRYWANEAAELNPFFNFAYAAHGIDAVGENPWGTFPLRPWGSWREDAMATLQGFPLDRLNWPRRNSHRLDIEPLRPPAVRDLYEADQRRRGYRSNGKVLPVENRHFNHWNTDPWQLDYGGAGNELASGTVFLLPYYLGMYHGFIERPETRP